MNIIDVTIGEFIYWLLHTSTVNIIALFMLSFLAMMIILNPHIFGRITVRKKRYQPRPESMKRNNVKYPGRKWHRNRLFAKSNLCGICKEPILNAKQATIDHIIPVSKGGADVISNMQLAHKLCNERKGNQIDYVPGDVLEPEFK